MTNLTATQTTINGIDYSWDCEDIAHFYLELVGLESIVGQIDLLVFGVIITNTYFDGDVSKAWTTLYKRLPKV